MPKLSPYTGTDIPGAFKKWLSQQLRRAVTSVPEFVSGTGSPEGVVTAKQFTFYLNTTGGAGTTLYVKRSTTGNTGWQAVG